MDYAFGLKRKGWKLIHLVKDGAKLFVVDLPFFLVVERIHQRFDVEVQLENLLHHMHHLERRGVERNKGK